MIAPTANRREALKAAFLKKHEPSSWLYRSAALPDLRPETVLTAPVWHACNGKAYPLIIEGDAE